MQRYISDRFTLEQCEFHIFTPYLQVSSSFFFFFGTDYSDNLWT